MLASIPFSSNAAVTFDASAITANSGFTINGGADTDLLLGSNFGLGNIVIGGGPLDPDDEFESNIFIGKRDDNSSIYIGKTSQTSIVDLGSGDVSTNVGIGFSSGDSNVSIGNGPTANPSLVDIGNGNVENNYTISMLSGVAASGVQTVNILNGTNTAGTAQVLNLGTGASRKTISIGNSTGATSVSIQAGTGGINIGTNTVNQAINIGTGVSTKTIIIGTTGTGAESASLTLRAGRDSFITMRGRLYYQNAGLSPSASQNAGTPTLETGSTNVVGHITTDTTAHTSITLTFNSAYEGPPVCIVTPADSDAAAIVGSVTGMYVTSTANDFTINHASSSVAADWNYYCSGMDNGGGE